MFAAFHQPTMKAKKINILGNLFFQAKIPNRHPSIQPTNQPAKHCHGEGKTCAGRSYLGCYYNSPSTFFAFTRKNINAHNQYNIYDDDDDNDDVLCNDRRQQMSTTSKKKHTHRAEKTTSMSRAHVMLRCDALLCFASDAYKPTS